MPQVSVIIPTRNRKHLVLRAIQCALGQRDVDLEIIVVDDGSTDGTSRAIRDQFETVTLARHDDARGVSEARNEGIKRSSTEWIAFLDDDDVWSPVKLRRQLDEVIQQGEAWVYAGMVTVNSELEILHGRVPESPEGVVREILIRNRLPSGPSNVVVHRDALRDAGGFDPDLRYHEDWDLWIRLAQVSRPSVVPVPLLGHVLHPGNTPIDAVRHDMEVIERRYSSLRRARRIDRGHVYRWMAGAHLRAGRRKPAAAVYARALLTSPLESAKLGARAALSRRIGPETAYRPPTKSDWRMQAETWLRPLRNEFRGGAQGGEKDLAPKKFEAKPPGD